jgi:hypothetical protein
VFVDASVIATERARRARETRAAMERRIPADLQLRGLPSIAERLLRQRAVSFGDELAAGLLDTLASLVAAAVPPSVLEVYAAACMEACFAPSRERVVVAPITVELSRALIAELAERANALEQAGDGQADVDANLNASAYYRSAKAIRDLISRS